MNAPTNEHKPKADLVDRLLEGKADDTKVRVLNLVYRLQINPDDPFFLVMIAMGYMQTLIEDSPHEWEETFRTFKEELNQWTNLHLETLESLARHAQTEENLADVSHRLTRLLERFMAAPSASSSSSPTPPLSSAALKAISQIPELSATLQNTDKQLHKLINSLPQALHRLSRNATAKVSLPSWLAILLTILSLTSVYNLMMLQAIRDAVLHPP